ncbi:MAG: DUF364 domain-containing protein [Spirochaetes bacterium]|nr:DUF364 domain-containing protein [Spirochaetota bacterium]
MRILEDIIASLKQDHPVNDIIRGPLWNAVVSRRCGLASSMIKGGCDSNADVEENAAFEIQSDFALEMCRMSLSAVESEASLGMAAINSLICIDADAHTEINASDFLSKAGKGKNISVIGHFPFVDGLEDVARNLWVIEKRPQPGDYRDSDSGKYLPRSEVIAISSTTLINHTLDSILSLCPEGSIKLLLGPSTPMTEVLLDYGIDILSGSVVTHRDAVTEMIRKGANFREIKKTGGIRFVNMIKDRGAFERIMNS